jgi:hypothetical protein
LQPHDPTKHLFFPRHRLGTERSCGRSGNFDVPWAYQEFALLNEIRGGWPLWAKRKSEAHSGVGCFLDQVGKLLASVRAEAAGDVVYYDGGLIAFDGLGDVVEAAGEPLNNAALERRCLLDVEQHWSFVPYDGRLYRETETTTESMAEMTAICIFRGVFLYPKKIRRWF